MTLVLSCITDDHAIQVSDRRLVRASGHYVEDDDANKAVLLNGHMAFAYTGLAHLEGLSTYRWLLNVLASESTNEFERIIDALCFRATEAVRKAGVPGEWRSHAFVGVGWYHDNRERLQPMIMQVSNFYNGQGERVALKGSLEAHAMVKAPRCRVLVRSHGQELPVQQMVWLKRTLRRLSGPRLTPELIISLLVRAMRIAASHNSAIGPNLMTVCIPRTSVRLGTATLVCGAPRVDAPSSWYLPADGRPVQYGPSMAAFGTQFITMEVRQHPPE